MWTFILVYAHLLACSLSWEWISFWFSSFYSCILLAFYSILFNILFNILFKIILIVQTHACIEFNAINNTELYINAQNILTLTYAEQLKSTSLIYKSKQKKFQINNINLILALIFWLIYVFFSKLFVNESNIMMIILLQKKKLLLFLIKKMTDWTLKTKNHQINDNVFQNEIWFVWCSICLYITIMTNFYRIQKIININNHQFSWKNNIRKYFKIL